MINYRFVKILLFGIILIFSFLLFYENRQFFNKLFDVAVIYIIFLAIMSILLLLINAAQFNCLLRIFELKLNVHEWLGLSIVNTLYNYWFPARGGSVSRAIYLKYKYNFSFSDYISLSGGAYIIQIFIASFSALLFITANYFLYGRFYGILFLISAILSVSLAVFIIFIIIFADKWKYRWKKSKLLDLVFNLKKGIHKFKKKYFILGHLIFSQILLIFISSIKLYISFKAIGLNPNFIDVIIIGSLVVFSMIISLTPGNLGIKEGIIGLLASMLDVSLKDAILAAILDRVVTMIVVIFFGIIYSYVLLSDINQNPKLNK